ncbi:MAG TPA: M23 family metallopeptidase [Stellaceae bacterium]|nr:M23 family metallopeptidase [Stellaceae bacterium]
MVLRGGGFCSARAFLGLLLLLGFLLTLAPALRAEEAIAPQDTASGAAVVPAKGPQIVLVALRRGDTLMSVLQGAGASAADAEQAIQSLAKLWSPREMKVGQELTIELGETHLQSLQFFAGLDRIVSTERGADGHFRGAVTPRALARVPAVASGVIKTSLYQAAIDDGVPLAVLEVMVRAFSYDVDFQRELQPGDRFEVMFERITDDSGKVVANGNVLYASMTLSKNTLRIYRFAAPGEDAEYFDAQGQSVKKALLRTPIDGVKITSPFGMRVHPILGYSLMHKGVDFGAAEGTPIMAAGDGVVEKAGPTNGYGNFVLLKHNGTYETAYAHMSRFAAGIRPGVHVRQGQIIGYVGATGLATGPHLHYEVRVDGTQVNPASVKFQPGRNLVGGELVAFHAETREIEQQLLTLTGRQPQVAAVPQHGHGGE